MGLSVPSKIVHDPARIGKFRESGSIRRQRKIGIVGVEIVQANEERMTGSFVDPAKCRTIYHGSAPAGGNVFVTQARHYVLNVLAAVDRTLDHVRYGFEEVLEAHEATAKAPLLSEEK